MLPGRSSAAQLRHLTAVDQDIVNPTENRLCPHYLPPRKFVTALWSLYVSKRISDVQWSWLGAHYLATRPHANDYGFSACGSNMSSMAASTCIMAGLVLIWLAD